MEQAKEPKKKKSWLLVTILIVALLVSFALGGLAVGLIRMVKECPTITNTITNKEEKEKKEEKTVTTSECVSSPVDFTKCINCEGDNNTFTSNATSLGISVSMEGRNKVRISYNGYQLSTNYSLGWVTGNEETKGIYEYLATKEFDKNISQIFIGGYGQAIVGNEAILYLMEDGTIQYTPILKEIKENWSNQDESKKFNSYGELSGVTEIVSIAGVGATGHATIIAQKADGSFYNLEKVLSATGNFRD